LSTKELVHQLYDKVGDLYSDEYEDGVFKLPSKIPRESQSIIADVYTLVSILKMKTEEDENNKRM